MTGSCGCGSWRGADGVRARDLCAGAREAVALLPCACPCHRREPDGPLRLLRAPTGPELALLLAAVRSHREAREARVRAEITQAVFALAVIVASVILFAWGVA